MTWAESFSWALARSRAPSTVHIDDATTSKSVACSKAMAIDQLIARDAVIRQAAFDHVRALQSRDLVLSHDDMRRGFMFEGERWPLWNPQRGIFRPREMPFLLSIRTVFPRKGGRIWYDDQRQVHQQIFAGEDELDYAFMGTDPSAAENVWLQEASERQIPFIYFLGVFPGRYQAMIPTFIVDWDPRRLSARIAFRRARGCYCHGDSAGRGRAHRAISGGPVCGQARRGADHFSARTGNV